MKSVRRTTELRTWEVTVLPAVARYWGKGQGEWGPRGKGGSWFADRKK